MHDTLIGRAIDGRYRVLSIIARGGMAIVYLAFDERLERQVALKVMHQHLSTGVDSEDFTQRFIREAKTAANLTHPGLVSVFDQGHDGDIRYLAMEYVPGTTLRKVLLEEGQISVERTLNFVRDILQALDTAHQNNLVHRDVKPENVLITPKGTIKLADFGLARAVTDISSTATTNVMGTVAYLSPELISHGRNDVRSDIYSIGVMMFEMLVGRLPYHGTNPLHIAYKHVNTDVPRVRSFRPEVPVAIDELIAAFCDRNPDYRPDNAHKALVLLQEIYTQLFFVPQIQDHTIPTTVLPNSLHNHQTTVLTPQRPTKDSHRIHTSWVFTGALATISLVLLGTWWFTQGPMVMAKIPNLSGLTFEQASVRLADEGFAVEQRFAFDDEIEKDNVISSDPSFGTKAKKNSSVTVLTSRGIETFTLPQDLVGKNSTDAVTQLLNTGFTNLKEIKEYNTTIAAGQVISVSPEAGKPLPHNEVITLHISNGPEPITVPNVVGKSEADALQTLGDLELSLKTTEAFSETVTKGEIISQDPKAGSSGLRGQELRVEISKGPQKLTVPDLVGKKVKDAESQLQELGLVPQSRPLFTFFGGETVTSQEISPGTKVDPGTTIKLWY